MIVASREHEFSYGHRVVGHEGKCKEFHGHNGKVIFHISATALDFVGRVVDFSVIKERLCQWLETFWDHKFLIYDKDPLFGRGEDFWTIPGLVRVPFNPTAENMAKYLVDVVGPKVLNDLAVKLISVQFYETSKCSASYDIVDQ